MPNQPLQLPNIDLPGAEYIALAPNRTLALQGRRRGQFNTGTTAVAGASLGQINGLIRVEDNFPQGAGIYIHHMSLQLQPSDNAGFLQIKSAQLGIGINPSAGVNDFALSVGVPLATLLSPTSGQIVITVPEMLILQRDMSTATGGTPMDTPGTVLNFSTNIWLQNTDIAANPHSAFAAIRFIYTRIDGATE